MFLMKFLNSIYNKKKFLSFNKGNHTRDFTYIDDAVEIMNALFKKKIKGHLFLIFVLTNLYTFQK